LDEVERAALDLVVDAAEILAEQADHDELDAARKRIAAISEVYPGHEMPTN